jgi:APA family basic amino acid/polyamine antiporter
LAIGVTTYVAFRRRQGLSLTETHKIVIPKPVVEHEVEYESILVAFEDHRFSPDVVASAARLAARRRRGIHVLVTITVPPNSPIDAPLPDEEARAASVIDQARVRGGRRVTGHWEKVRPGGAGRRIVEEAREIRARALVMALPPRRAGMSLFGKTLETVLAERPCRVIIESDRGVDGSRNGA